MSVHPFRAKTDPLWDVPGPLRLKTDAAIEQMRREDHERLRGMFIGFLAGLAVWGIVVAFCYGVAWWAAR